MWYISPNHFSEMSYPHIVNLIAFFLFVAIRSIIIFNKLQLVFIKYLQAIFPNLLDPISLSIYLNRFLSD